MGPKGLEPLPPGLKGRYAAVTPRPRIKAGRMRFQGECFIVLVLSGCGSPESRTQRHSVISRMRATGPRLPMLSVFRSRDGRSRTCVLVLPKHTGSPLPYIPSFQSERPDLNRGHRRAAVVGPGPRPGAIPRLRYVLFILSVARTGVEPVFSP